MSIRRKIKGFFESFIIYHRDDNMSNRDFMKFLIVPEIEMDMNLAEVVFNRTSRKPEKWSMEFTIYEGLDEHRSEILEISSCNEFEKLISEQLNRCMIEKEEI